MRFAALLLLLSALLGPAPAAQAAGPAPGADGSTHSSVVQAATKGSSTGGGYRGGYRSTTIGGTGSSGSSSGPTPRWVWPAVLVGGGLLVWIIVADRRKRNRGD